MPYALVMTKGSGRCQAVNFGVLIQSVVSSSKSKSIASSRSQTAEFQQSQTPIAYRKVPIAKALALAKVALADIDRSQPMPRALRLLEQKYILSCVPFYRLIGSKTLSF